MSLGVTSYDQWQAWRQNGGFTTLPYLHTIAASLPGHRLADWLGAWQAASPYAIILESGKTGRYTYLGLRPAEVLRGKDGRAERLDPIDGTVRESLHGAPLEVVRAWHSRRRSPRLEGAPPLLGGSAGYWSYDVVRAIESLPVQAQDDLRVPDYLFLQLDELWIIDHERDLLHCAVHTHLEPDAPGGDTLRASYDEAAQRAQEMARLWRELCRVAGDGAGAAADRRRREQMRADDLQINVEDMTGIRSPFSKRDFEAAVLRIQDYIAQGDVFQVNLSLRQSRELLASSEELYEWLRLINPSPYMGMLRCPDFQLVSASPELLVLAREGRLAARPIAGTRRRGRTEAEDAALAEELRTNEKERAEHIMLVDLERNDLGRIAAYGSVRVDELMIIERYSHVMHLVSQVEARLAAGKDAFDVVAATFPGGTITGAPKIRTMEIIEELEPVRRGPYTGSMGWIDYNGDMEFNIIIRTMTVKDGSVHIQAGAGIVIDSDPEREYYESLNKAKALWKAIEYSERTAGTAAR
ncbi:anthranilate synthase component I family protein [Paenibacillus sabuli]|uniref:anthranilate synthase component I family protein n=1 Tax=Paenibacillus sabuli TaxID=2772509 RepID=UPI0037CB827F